jgi:hypothetical protein
MLWGLKPCSGLSGFDIICFYNNFKPSGLSNKNMFEYQHKDPEGQKQQTQTLQNAESVILL